MAQLGIVGLDAIGLTLARRDGVLARIVDVCLIEGEGIRVVLLGGGCPLDGRWQGLPSVFPDHGPTGDAARGPVRFRHDVAGVF